MIIKYDNLLFLDFDGVINSQSFYIEKYSYIARYDDIPFYKTVKKYLRKLVKTKQISDMEYYKNEIDTSKVLLLNELCAELNIGVIISSTWRLNKTIEQLQEILNNCGATFTIIDKTPYTGYERGTEISKWLEENVEKWFDIKYYDFYKYVIIDDDSDMLLNQQHNFFQTDNHVGLTPTTIYKIKRFLKHKTF